MDPHAAYIVMGVLWAFLLCSLGAYARRRRLNGAPHPGKQGELFDKHRAGGRAA